MNKKIVGIIGSYRKGGITDQTIGIILDAARQKGAQTKKIYLTDKQIEFCTNCRICMEDGPEKKRGRCTFNDGMEELLVEIDSADGLVFGSPVNFGTVTAIMKRFVERLAVYGYWPWDKPAPELRIKESTKKAVLVTSSACPAFIGRFLKNSALNVMKKAAGAAGAKEIKMLYFGMVCLRQEQKLNNKQVRSAELAGNWLVA